MQDLDQLTTRWGASRAHTIFANLPTKVVLPGVANRKDLEDLAYLGGEREVTQTSEGHSSSGDGSQITRSTNRHRTREPVITGHTIHTLPHWHAYVLGLGPQPAIVRFTPGYKLLTSRGLRRRLAAAATPAPAPAPPVIPLRRRKQVPDLDPRPSEGAA